jgi:hypothetical protein
MTVPIQKHKRSIRAAALAVSIAAVAYYAPLVLANGTTPSSGFQQGVHSDGCTEVLGIIGTNICNGAGATVTHNRDGLSFTVTATGTAYATFYCADDLMHPVVHARALQNNEVDACPAGVDTVRVNYPFRSVCGSATACGNY